MDCLHDLAPVGQVANEHERFTTEDAARPNGNPTLEDKE
jgi:hypothetical protein